MANKNYDPNARYDNGPNAAGSGRVSSQGTMNTATYKGLRADGTVGAANSRPGSNAAGAVKNNTGPNVVGAQRSYNND
jgi:hypothetical protein